MTAIVGFLNKHCVAVAADSAVTFGNTHKVVNSANKIFSLSKYAPVGIATYNNASFMGTPWEIIIKQYRKELGNKTLPHLCDYSNNFIDYLHEKNFFVSEDVQKNHLLNMIYHVYGLILNDESLSSLREEEKPSKFAELLANAITLLQKFNQRSEEFRDYTIDDFNRYTKDIISNILNREMYLTEASTRDLFIQTVYEYSKACMADIYTTGLVFFGYGEDEIYPCLYNIEVANAFDHRLRYYVNKNNEAHIGDDSLSQQAAIRPFAQTDVTTTILRGIHPRFMQTFSKTYLASLQMVQRMTLAQLPQDKAYENIRTQVENLDLNKLSNDYSNHMFQDLQTNYTDHLLDTITHLDKEDLANMAESLVSLTSLIRRMSPGEETVGGPIDVAIISKGDGFIWKKRKHYFERELNEQYFHNYYL